MHFKVFISFFFLPSPTYFNIKRMKKGNSPGISSFKYLINVLVPSFMTWALSTSSNGLPSIPNVSNL